MLGTAQRLRPARPKKGPGRSSVGQKQKPLAQASHQPRPPHQLPQEEVHDPSAQVLPEGCASVWRDVCSAWAEAEVEVAGSAAGVASEACSMLEAEGSGPKPVAAPAEGEPRRLRWQLRHKCPVCHEEDRCWNVLTQCA